jgi:hypothetical protein
MTEEGIIQIAPIISALAASLALLTTITIFLFQIRTSNRLRSADLILKLEAMYDLLCAARMKEPWLVSALKDTKDIIVGSMSDEQRSAFHYTEMVFGFIESAVFLRYQESAISDNQWNMFILPMLTMEYRYSGPLLHYVADQVGLSKKTRDLLEDLRKQYPDGFDTRATPAATQIK